MQQAGLPTGTKFRVGNKTVTIQQRLGNGAFGVVNKVIEEKASSKVYALKDILCLNASALNNAVREAQLLSQIPHENVIAIMGTESYVDNQGSTHMLLLTEYCSGGNLNERLARTSTEKMNLKWMSQIAAALSHLHSQGVVHRDLKPENVLLTGVIEDVKLADFGLAREYIALKRADAKQDDDSWMASYTQYYMNSMCGTIYWMAPEFFTNGHYTEKADVFSLGTLFYAILQRDCIMIDGKAYYGAFYHLGEKVGLGYAMAMFDKDINIAFSSLAQGSKDLQSVALAALQYNKDDRPSAQEVYNKIEEIRT